MTSVPMQDGKKMEFFPIMDMQGCVEEAKLIFSNQASHLDANEGRTSTNFLEGVGTIELLLDPDCVLLKVLVALTVVNHKRIKGG